MDVEIRPLRESEIPQAAAVADISFRTNIGSIVRTPEVWRWRYWEMPGFDPRGAIAAVAGGRVVGTVMVTRRRLWLDRWVRFGVVDDVATLPGWRGKGVARRMMEEALRLMEASGAEGTYLYADPKGFARFLYLDLGYRDFHPFHLWIRPLPTGLLADIAPWLFPLPAGWPASPLPEGFRVWRRGESGPYREAMERTSRHLAGVPETDEGTWTWLREGNPTRPLMVGLGDPPRAGTTLCPARTALLSSIEVPGLWLGDFFAGDGCDPLPGALAVARRMRCGFLGAAASPLDRGRTRLLARHRFIPAFPASLMVRPFGRADFGAHRRRPWFPMMESVTGVP